MPTPTGNLPSIEGLTPQLRQQVIDKLVAGESSRAVSAFLAENGHKLSHKAVNGYNQRVIKPALKVGAKLQRLEALESGRNPGPIDTAREVQEVTKVALAADPILDRVNWLRSEIVSGIEDSKAGGDLRARASMLNVARGAIETEAKALQHPGFVASATSQTTNNVVVVMPSIQQSPEAPALRLEAADVIDVSFDSDKR